MGRWSLARVLKLHNLRRDHQTDHRFARGWLIGFRTSPIPAVHYHRREL